MVPLSWYLILSAILFSLGVFGFLLKRNIITIFMSIELMLNAVNLSFVAFANYWNTHAAAQRHNYESPERPGVCLLRDGGGRGGSGRGTGHYHFRFPHP